MPLAWMAGRGPEPFYLYLLPHLPPAPSRYPSVARLRGFGAAGDEFHLDVGGAAEKCGDNLPVALGEDEVGGRFADGKIVDAEIVDALR